MWLGIFYVGYALWSGPRTGCHRGVPHRRPSAVDLRLLQTHGFFETAVLTAAMAALITVTLQIAYLPQLYGAFNRRETEIALLNCGPAARHGARNYSPDPLCPRLWHIGA